MNANHDVLIIGAGLSGIGMACHLAEACPDKSVGILERLSAIGGTWDLFQYPGIRSDSDMFSFGYKQVPPLARVESPAGILAERGSVLDRHHTAGRQPRYLYYLKLQILQRDFGLKRSRL